MMYARGWEFPAFFFWQNETIDRKELYVQTERGVCKMVKKRLILQLQQKEIAALEEIIQTYHNYVAKIVYSILSFYSTEIDIQAVINQVFFALGKGRTDRYK